MVIAEALLRPEGALPLQVDLVGSEEGCQLQPLQNWRDSLIQVLELLNWCASSVNFARDDLCCALWRDKRAWELCFEEI